MGALARGLDQPLPTISLNLQAGVKLSHPPGAELFVSSYGAGWFALDRAQKEPAPDLLVAGPYRRLAFQL